MNNKNTDYYFLRGGGEMGELIRAKDWSKTSLGDPADWPESLRTMVAVILDNPFGMYIAWGSEYIQLYNDGYRPILGSIRHCWSPDHSIRFNLCTGKSSINNQNVQECDARDDAMKSFGQVNKIILLSY